ncbi:hypothetical protein [Rhizobium fabae]|uniref:Uncharacterized protein n=1 Tax=Rhizobium fabae TaxID=573179 RepID=A0A7W6FH97_9HYPH|nr:hypothetical protein [Rhizobium fabae]MBB3913893.1 hypothetical protein [Rhizobium fabae]RUM16293.1 hypothetical protein EFB14_02940 [Rhizobium fabae]
MLDKPVQAAGEAMLTRRQLIAASSAAAAVGVAGMAPIAAHAAAADPILDAVSAFRAGMADFNANAPLDDAGTNAYSAISWKPPHAVLTTWTAPAISRDGAMAALRLAVEEEDTGDSPLVGPMMRAALAYLEQEGAL